MDANFLPAVVVSCCVYMVNALDVDLIIQFSVMKMKKLFVILLSTLLLCGTVNSQDSGKKDDKQQFIYVLKLIPRLLNEKNWTEQDDSIVGKHFRRLQKLRQEGKVILAGRTLNETDPSQFGIVVLEVGSEEEARKIMEEDDAVKEKIMTAQLFPFKVALIR